MPSRRQGDVMMSNVLRSKVSFFIHYQADTCQHSGAWLAMQADEDFIARTFFDGDLQDIHLSLLFASESRKGDFGRKGKDFRSLDACRLHRIISNSAGPKLLVKSRRSTLEPCVCRSSVHQ